jgi:hypothetical protein
MKNKAAIWAKHVPMPMNVPTALPIAVPVADASTQFPNSTVTVILDGLVPVHFLTRLAPMSTSATKA